MKKRLLLSLTPAGIAGVALVAAGCGGGGGGSGSAASGYAAVATKPTVAVNAGTIGERHTKLGNVLVDSQDRTVYLFERDRGMASSCTGACASIWPPVTATAKGEGLSQFGAEWNVVFPSGRKIDDH